AFSIVDHGSAISLYEMRGQPKKYKKKEDGKDVEYSGAIRIPGCGLYFSDGNELYPFNAWAITSDGYFNLMKLASLGYDTQIEIDGITRPVLTIEQIRQHSEGLVFGTGDVYGAVGEHIRKGDKKSAEISFGLYLDVFGKENLLVEFSPVSISESYSAKTG